jgi:hypothetical protein
MSELQSQAINEVPHIVSVAIANSSWTALLTTARPRNQEAQPAQRTYAQGCMPIHAKMIEIGLMAYI